MKIELICIGRARGSLADAIADYEARISHYFSFQPVELKETTVRGGDTARTVHEEGERILARLSPQHELVALHRPGKAWRSEALARYLSEADLRPATVIAFAIGGAYGLHPTVLERANHAMSLSALTMPHELARLVLTEQIYRAGTIARGEPYHKGTR